MAFVCLESASTQSVARLAQRLSFSDTVHCKKRESLWRSGASPRQSGNPLSGNVESQSEAFGSAVFARPGLFGDSSTVSRLEQLNRVAVRIFNLNLFATWADFHLISEAHSSSPEVGNTCRQILHLKDHTVPST